MSVIYSLYLTPWFLSNIHLKTMDFTWNKKSKVIHISEDTFLFYQSRHVLVQTYSIFKKMAVFLRFRFFTFYI